jgi:hypothetical protein
MTKYSLYILLYSFDQNKSFLFYFDRCLIAELALAVAAGHLLSRPTHFATLQRQLDHSGPYLGNVLTTERLLKRVFNRSPPYPLFTEKVAGGVQGPKIKIE